MPATRLDLDRIRAARRIRLVEDSLDIETCEGAATIGLELADHRSTFDAVLIACKTRSVSPAAT